VSVDRIPLPTGDGELYLCGLRDVGNDPDALLGRLGASTIVCLNPERELDRRAPDYVPWLRANQGERALWFPIRNFEAESADATMPFLDLVVERLDRGDRVVMHCALGQGRAGTMAVCLLVMLGAPPDDALQAVAAHRTFAGPGDGSQWRLVDDVARAVSLRGCERG
jgi:protein-tyrosine phosphatase